MVRLSDNEKISIINSINEGISINEISKITNRNKSTIYYYYSKIKGKRYKEPVFAENCDHKLGEIAGIFAGDGSQHHDLKRGLYVVNVHSSNSKYLNYVKNLFEQYFNRNFYICNDKNRAKRIRVASKKIYLHFHKYLSFKSSIKHSTVKLHHLSFSKDFLKGFLKGLLDTDGTICLGKTKGKRIIYYTTSNNLAEQIKTLLNKFQIKCGISIRKYEYKDLYQIYVFSESIDDFLNIIKPFKDNYLGR